jgi:hypothetical protein
LLYSVYIEIRLGLISRSFIAERSTECYRLFFFFLNLASIWWYARFISSWHLGWFQIKMYINCIGIPQYMGILHLKFFCWFLINRKMFIFLHLVWSNYCRICFLMDRNSRWFLTCFYTHNSGTYFILKLPDIVLKLSTKKVDHQF